MAYSKLLALKIQKTGEQVVDSMLRMVNRLSRVVGTSGDLITLALTGSLQAAGLKEKLISVAGRAAVAEVEAGDLDAENFVRTCVYDNVL